VTTPRVSILVPAYNDAEFLPHGLESLRQQSFADFEVVISDDCSSDATRTIATSYAQADARFRVLTNVQNLGMTRNWNRALREARGEYVVKLDADDAFRPDALRALVAAMEGSERPAVVYCRTLSCNDALEPFASYLGDNALIVKRVNPLSVHVKRGHDWYQYALNDIQLWHSNAQIHRRATLLEMGGWDESWGCAADTDLILRVLERDEVVVHLPDAGVLYRHRAGSVSDLYRREAWLRWESALVHLESLTRYLARGGPVDLPMRKAWWRYWVQWNRLQKQGVAALDTLRVDIRDRLKARMNEVVPPPLRVRIEGRLRQWVWDRLHG
jgi:glycosyltransferase involved in cell wall biosynthesis